MDYLIWEPLGRLAVSADAGVGVAVRAAIRRGSAGRAARAVITAGLPGAQAGAARRKEDRVDDVDDAVRRGDVRCGDPRTVDEDPVIGDRVEISFFIL